MTYLFISHSNQDRALTFTLGQFLIAHKYDIFVDFSPKYGIPGGAVWEEALLKALHQSAGLLLCCTPASFTSQWCFGEVIVARFAGIPVFPLLFQGDAKNIWDFLRVKIQHIDFTSDPDRAFDHLISSLRKAGL